MSVFLSVFEEEVGKEEGQEQDQEHDVKEEEDEDEEGFSRKQGAFLGSSKNHPGGTCNFDVDIVTKGRQLICHSPC